MEDIAIKCRGASSLEAGWPLKAILFFIVNLGLGWVFKYSNITT